MKPLMIAIGAFIALLVLASAINGVTEQLRQPSDLDYARASAEMSRLSRERDSEETWQPIRAAALNIAAIIFVLSAAASASAWAVAAVIRFRRERTPNHAGLLPVLAADLGHVAPQALGAFHAARQLEAQRQPVPHTITYSPHAAYHHRADSGGTPVLPAPESIARELPSFAQLLSAGRIGRGQPICLGLDTATGEGIWGDWRDLYSAGLGGKQGSGKTWTAASLIAQSLLGGAHVILCDPHAGDDESLLTRLTPLLPFCTLTAEEPSSILEAARYAHDEFERRKDAARAKQPHDRTPVIIVIDEWTSLLRGDLGERLPPLLASLSTEGRKYGVNALLLAQRWEAEAAGGSDVRNTLTAHYVHRCRGDEGRMQTGMRAGAWPGDPITLEPGQSYLFSTRGDVRLVQTPRMTPADLAAVAARLHGVATTRTGPVSGPAPRPVGFHVQAAPTAPAQPRPSPGPDSGPDRASASGSGTAPFDTPDAETLRILAKFRAGASMHDLATEVSGTSNPGDRRYKKARAKIEELVRSQVNSGAAHALPHAE